MLRVLIQFRSEWSDSADRLLMLFTSEARRGEGSWELFGSTSAIDYVVLHIATHTAHILCTQSVS